MGSAREAGIHARIVQLQDRRHELFFWILLGTSIFYPFILLHEVLVGVLYVGMSALLIWLVGSYTGYRNSLFSVFLCVGLIAIVCSLGLVTARGNPGWERWQIGYAISASIMYLLTGVIMSKSILEKEDVGRETMLGVCCVYYLQFFFWASIYTAIYLLGDGKAFELNFTGFSGYQDDQVWFQFAHYSVMVLTGNGVRNIEPVQIITQGLTQLEAFLGMLFSVILVANLAGKFSWHSSDVRRLDEERSSSKDVS